MNVKQQVETWGRDALAASLALLLPFVVHWRLLTTNMADRLYITQDVAVSIYPALVHVGAVVAGGELPLWNWHVYSGMFEGGAYYNPLLYPLNFPYFLGWVDLARTGVFHAYLLLHLGIGAAGFYLLARGLRFHPALAGAGAAAYGLSFHGAYSLVVGNSFLMPLAWMPFVLFFWHGALTGKGPRWALLGGLAWLFCLFSANPLDMVPLFALLLLWVALWGAEGGRRGALSWAEVVKWFLLVNLVVGGMWAVQWLPFLESTSVAYRNATADYEWARLSYSVPKDFALLLGDLVLPHWGSELFISSGAAWLALFVFGAWAAKLRWERALVGFCLITAAVLYLPANLFVYDLSYGLIPLVSRMNGFDRGSLAFVLAATLLFMAGGRALMRMPRRSMSATTVLLSLATAAAVIALAYLLVEGSFPAIFYTDDAAVSLAIQVGFFFTVTLLLIKRMAARRRWRRGGRFYFWILLIVSVEAASLSVNYFFKAKMPAESMHATAFFNNRSSYYPDGTRFLDLERPSIASPRVNVVRSQEGMLRGEDNVAGYYQFQPRWVTEAFFAAGFEDYYLVRGVTKFDKSARWSAATVAELYDLGAGRVGRAYPVAAGRAVEGEEEALAAVAAADFQPREALVYQRREPSLALFPSLYRGLYELAAPLLGAMEPSLPALAEPRRLNDSTWLTAQSANGAAFRVHADGGYLFVSNSWHPGWMAFVDGEPTPVLKANLAFSAVPLPEGMGERRVELLFRPASSYLGLLVSLLSTALFLFLYARFPRFARGGRPASAASSSSGP